MGRFAATLRRWHVGLVFGLRHASGSYGSLRFWGLRMTQGFGPTDFLGWWMGQLVGRTDRQTDSTHVRRSNQDCHLAQRA